MSLSPELLARIRGRAAAYDRDNAFFSDDLDELREAGYLAPRSLLQTARYVVDQAMRVGGGGAYRASSELARLQRDVLAGIYHPSDTESVHSTVAANLLGPLL